MFRKWFEPKLHTFSIMHIEVILNELQWTKRRSGPFLWRMRVRT